MSRRGIMAALTGIKGAKKESYEREMALMLQELQRQQAESDFRSRVDWQATKEEEIAERRRLKDESIDEEDAARALEIALSQDRSLNRRINRSGIDMEGASTRDVTTLLQSSAADRTRRQANKEANRSKMMDYATSSDTPEALARRVFGDRWDKMKDERKRRILGDATSAIFVKKEADRKQREYQEAFGSNLGNTISDSSLEDTVNSLGVALGWSPDEAETNFNSLVNMNPHERVRQVNRLMAIAAEKGKTSRAGMINPLDQDKHMQQILARQDEFLQKTAKEMLMAMGQSGLGNMEGRNAVAFLSEADSMDIAPVAEMLGMSDKDVDNLYTHIIRATKDDRMFQMTGTPSPELSRRLQTLAASFASAGKVLPLHQAQPSSLQLYGTQVPRLGNIQ